MSDSFSALGTWQEVLILLIDLVDNNIVTSNVNKLLVMLKEQAVLDLGINTEKVLWRN